MAVYQDKKIENESIVLDGNEFIACEFADCRMIYRGGEHPKIQHCHFQRCSWHLEDAAQRTVLFLKSIYHSGPGGQELVEETLRHIRMK